MLLTVSINAFAYKSDLLHKRHYSNKARPPGFAPKVWL